jgi:2-oxoacid:acceptor oxidoreductase gamma subunit (pyruvate/2-ketoisovalerate family)
LKEIRFHGRGGQGVVTAAEVLATATLYEDKYGQSFPFFGPERRGAPVVSYLRIDDQPIRLRMGIYYPDAVVVLDPQLPNIINVMAGLKNGGVGIFNSRTSPPIFNLEGKARKIASVDATGIALEVIGRPITNMVMLGAFSAATGWLTMDAISKAIKERFSGETAEKNEKATLMAYKNTKCITLGD